MYQFLESYFFNKLHSNKEEDGISMDTSRIIDLGLPEDGASIDTSPIIDLGLPEDRKPMPLSEYNNGQRWGWVKGRRGFSPDYSKDIKNEYHVAGKPESLPRDAGYWLEELIKEAEKKLNNKCQDDEESCLQGFFKSMINTDLIIDHYSPSKKNKNQAISSDEPEKTKTCIVGDRTVAIGTKDKIYVTGDFGLLGAVLEAYNHHWNLKISPDDFWIPVAIRIGSKINNVAKSNKVRDFFVDFDGKKEIAIYTDQTTIYGVDNVWLLEQFSEKIKENIKKDEYTELMTSNFSTTTPVSKIASQINIMASLQEYFEFRMVLSCGIKGVEMLGNLEDWQQLVKKIDKLAKLLSPLEEELKISGWLKHVRMVYVKLVETFKRNPDQDWWSRIISKVPLGSGRQTQYEGWLIKFLEDKENVEDFTSMTSGLTTVPLNVTYDENLEGEMCALAAGQYGFTIEDDTTNGIPTVCPYIGWALLLPKESPFRCT